MAEQLPDDIYEESRFRLPLPVRGDLTPAAQKIFDKHVDPEGGFLAGVRGPGGIKLHSSGYSENSVPQLQYLRHGTGISNAIRELAILTTAREHDSQFEWSQHEPEGLRQGLSQEAIDVVKYRKPVDDLSETEATVITFGRQLFQNRHVEPEVFAKGLEIFGRQKLVDLVCLMGAYAATAALLVAFDARMPDDEVFILPLS